ncbi:MBL fold metallo-hydrolase, partial [Chromohalobacter japonicus]|uniref:MBL fold metallo-hydrolase n=1 Tax=Chromohalobacter japonicus TaxID=223900 RepID=UPI003F925A7A
MSLIRLDAASWYRTTSFDDGITRIDEPAIKPFYRCNIWHVRGRERDLLVDFGLGAVPLRRQVPLLSERDLIAVASHTHFDHIGSAHEFDCCHVHAAEADILANPDNARTLADAFLDDAMFDALPPSPFEHHRYRIAPPTRIATLEDGEIIYDGPLIEDVYHSNARD